MPPQTPVDVELLSEIRAAAQRLEGVVTPTPVQQSDRLSKLFGARIFLKREDLHVVRSFKIRGAYNRISALPAADRARGIVCASAGNHAQGVAYSCATLGITGTIFMPTITPSQKIDRVRHFGGEFTSVELVGDSYDEASQAALERCAELGAVFIHPFDDLLIIAGQGTVGKEIRDQVPGVEVVVAAVGGGGLATGTAAYLHSDGGDVSVIGAEPAGAPSMRESLRQGEIVTLDRIDTFVDGAAVKRVGELTFSLAQRHLSRVVVVPEGRVCTTVIELYQNEGIIAEPAGALAVAALDDIADEIAGRTVVCVISGGNNDILRYPEIMERSLVHQGRKHYFLVEFTQKPGQLRQFVDRALGPTDDIVRFEYIKKTNKERGAALVGIELRDRADLEPLLDRMRAIQLNCRRLDDGELLYDYLI